MSSSQHDLTLSYTTPLIYASLRGVRWDHWGQELLKKEYADLIHATYAELTELTGGNVNVKSGPQMAAAIKRMGYSVRKTPKGNPRLEANDLREIRRKAKPAHAPFFDKAIELRQQLDFYNKYVCMTPDITDGRMRCSYNVCGTDTFRISSSESIFQCGSNLQNIPNKMDPKGRLRNLFIADEEHIFGEMDLSQAEVWIVAMLSGDEATLEILRDPDADIHTYNASLIFKAPEPEVTKRQRHLGKLCKHAVNYGMTWKGLIENAMEEDLYISAAEAKELIASTKAACPLLEDWQRSIREQLFHDRTLTTPLGKRRVFGGELQGGGAPSTFRKAYAFIPQSTVGELTLRAAVRLFNAGYDFLLTVHDSNLVQVPVENVGDLWYAKDLMIEPITITDMFGKERELTIPSELEVGFRWGSLKEVTSEDELPKMC